MIQLKPLQDDAYQTWLGSDRRGTIEAVTGCGKTVIGIKAIEELLPSGGKVLVVVPTLALAKQWKEEIQKFLGIEASRSLKKPAQVMIQVVNSVRWQALDFDLVILDEVHRYSSKCNLTFLPPSKFTAIMGLSATAERADGRHKEMEPYAPIIFTIDAAEAAAAGLISTFMIRNIAVQPTETESQALGELDAGIRSVMHKMKCWDIFEIQKRAARWDRDAMDALSLMQQRIGLIATSESKLAAADLLLEHELKNEKTIVFCERVEAAEALLKPGRMIYHSKSNEQAAIDSFTASRGGVLITVRALDEGLNVVDCKRAIIVSGSSVKRQIIQRVGRLLRKTADGKNAVLYQLYLAGTKDVDYVKKRTAYLEESATDVSWEDL